MRGGRERAVLGEAILRIEQAFPGARLSDAEDVLLALAGRYYTVADLSRLVGRERMMQSSLYVEGHAEGRLAAERELCTALAQKHHPAVFDRVQAVIQSCDDPARLKEWSLASSDLSDDAFVRLLGA